MLMGGLGAKASKIIAGGAFSCCFGAAPRGLSQASKQLKPMTVHPKTLKPQAHETRAFSMFSAVLGPPRNVNQGATAYFWSLGDGLKP